MSDSLSTSLNTLFGQMESFISSKTVVGEPTQIGDVIIVPLVDISFGMGAGVADQNDSAKEKENSKDEISRQNAAGGGLGAKITPSAVLVIMNGEVQLVNVKNQDAVNKLIDMAPGVLTKLGGFLKKDKDSKAEEKSDDLFED